MKSLEILCLAIFKKMENVIKVLYQRKIHSPVFPQQLLTENSKVTIKRISKSAGHTVIK